MQASPWITPADAAEWAGVDEQRIVDAIDTGDLGVLRLGRKVVRLEEHEVGRAFGLDLPGPRERALAAEWAARRARPAKAKPKPVADHWLYWFYDATGLLLYIGITNSGVKRMEQHGADKVWWPKVATIKVDHFATREQAEDAEREAIRTYLPIHNGTHSVRFEKGQLC